MGKRAAIGVGTAALVGIAAARMGRTLGAMVPRNGTFPNGIPYARWGEGPETLLWLPQGPGMPVPSGPGGAVRGREFQRYVDAGYSVWFLGRKPNMPTGYSVADMAEDVAEVIEAQFHGTVDAVVGISSGGLLAQYLAANHPGSARSFVLMLAAGSITDRGRDLDHRWALARAEGRHADAARVFTELILPEGAPVWQQRAVALLMRAVPSGEGVPVGDILVEAEAELVFDAREVLPRIKDPVLLISAEKDLYFPAEIVDETASLITDCTVVRLKGVGHLGAMMSGKASKAALDFLTT